MSIKRVLHAVLTTTAGLVFLALGAHPAAAATDLVEDCSDDNYVLRVKEIAVTPPFPEPGKPFRWEITGKLREPIDLHRSTADVKVRRGVTTLVSAKVSLHDALTYGGMNPPDTLGKGRVTMAGEVELPDEVAQGVYRLSLRAWDEDKQNLACLKARVDMRRP
ncbi:ML domain-containing protein [Allorhizocola rhizosphaerae]|uniref:ML domain-containing protein n=1 Tax=Allorhizocola rhizosphaerae TaxID=1872709 RepID=UPI000E3DD9C9|nr:ML domain-containing protein [Allorhizocola rhizosphaerae]